MSKFTAKFLNPVALLFLSTPAVTLAQPSSPSITYTTSFSVPTIGSYALMSLAILLAGCAVWLLRGKPGLGTASMLIGSAAIALTATMAYKADALNAGEIYVTLGQADGGTLTLTPSFSGTNLWVVTSTLDKPLQITQINAGTCTLNTVGTPSFTPKLCTQGLVLNAGEECELFLDNCP